MPEIRFFIGKGGVGKSTTAALTALQLSTMGRRVHLVSMDPAHNQSDLFETPFTEFPRRLGPGLRVSEIDLARWTARYLRETREQIRKAYLYETAFSLQHHFKILQHAPGIEEYALLIAFEHTLAAAEDDILLVDMAPTAVALRFFALPFATLAWVSALLKLREQICRKKEIIARIQRNDDRLSGDRVRDRLVRMVDRYRRLGALFQSASVRVQLVTTPEPLSLAEARRIHAKMVELGIPVAALIVNKADPASPYAAVAGLFRGIPVQRVPASARPLIGAAALRAHAALLEASVIPPPAGPYRTRPTTSSPSTSPFFTGC